MPAEPSRTGFHRGSGPITAVFNSAPIDPPRWRGSSESVQDAVHDRDECLQRQARTLLYVQVFSSTHCADGHRQVNAGRRSLSGAAYVYRAWQFGAACTISIDGQRSRSTRTIWRGAHCAASGRRLETRYIVSAAFRRASREGQLTPVEIDSFAAAPRVHTWTDVPPGQPDRYR